jgi:hypothetical protein
MADKFRKGKSNFATTLVTGIGTGTGDTITLNSTTGLPTDTEITLTFNRVTSGGVVNSTSVMERITGTISGATLTSYRRGVDGTTEQAHAGGTVVEYIPNAADMNDQVDGILVEHNQDGTHNTTKVVDLDTEQTLTNKTLTSPKINEDVAVTSTATELNLLDGIVGLNKMPINAPEGFLLNGKIVPSVADDDLTVALKGLDGNDPSATNPVYCRIGDTVHAITAALSVTKADGTNWFNAGSAELATKEIDYFVYLGYNATDGVVIGFSRIPYATDYSQFSDTTTSDRYCAISTITNAAAGDVYTVIGRFAATLSAGAGYTWSVPTFTTVNLIQRPIFETRVLTWQPTYSANGSMTYTSVTETKAGYKVTDNKVNILLNRAIGTTGGTASTGITVTLPFAPKVDYTEGGAFTYDTKHLGGGFEARTTGVCTVYKYDGSNWALAASKIVGLNMSYEI